jgi:hypothetical protein
MACYVGSAEARNSDSAESHNIEQHDAQYDAPNWFDALDDLPEVQVSNGPDDVGSASGVSSRSDLDGDDGTIDSLDSYEHGPCRLNGALTAATSFGVFRREGGTSVRAATDAEKAASPWSSRSDFGNAGSPYSPWKSQDEWQLVHWLCQSELSQSEINKYLQLNVVSMILIAKVIIP